MSAPAIYRHFDANGILLYVGFSLCPLRRLNAHKQSHWFDAIFSVTIERFNSIEAALSAEKKAIKAGLPLHNICHTKETDSIIRTRSKQARHQSSPMGKTFPELLGIFNGNKSRLAKAMKISRPTIYVWKFDHILSHEAISRVRDWFLRETGKIPKAWMPK